MAICQAWCIDNTHRSWPSDGLALVFGAPHLAKCTTALARLESLFGNPKVPSKYTDLGLQMA